MFTHLLCCPTRVTLCDKLLNIDLLTEDIYQQISPKMSCTAICNLHRMSLVWTQSYQNLYVPPSGSPFHCFCLSAIFHSDSSNKGLDASHVTQGLLPGRGNGSFNFHLILTHHLISKCHFFVQWLWWLTKFAWLIDVLCCTQDDKTNISKYGLSKWIHDGPLWLFPKVIYR